MSRLGLLIILTLVSVTSARAVVIEEKVSITNSAITNFDLDQVVEDFCSLAMWHPAISTCEKDNRAGITRRTVTLANGDQIVERLLMSSGQNMVYTIEITPFPVKNYISQIAIERGQNATTIIWRGMFDVDGGNDRKVAETFKSMYAVGLENIKKIAENK